MEASTPATPEPAVTVIMPTFRRPSSLGRALASLAAQEAPGLSWELVLVDNDDPPGAEAVFGELAEAFSIAARLVRERKRGSAHARNLGIAESRGGIVAMIDDDVVAAPDWLATLVEPIIAGRCDATGGRVILDPTVVRPRWYDEERVGPYLTHFDPSRTERTLEEGEYVLTANAAWRAEPLRETGGFDPALGPRDGRPIVNDDVLLSRRFQAVGGRMRYVPEAVVVHELPPERLRRWDLLRRVYYFGRSEWIMEREHYETGRLNGARVALASLASLLRDRAREGLGRPEVAFHAACHVARTLGAVREAVSWMVARRR
jgi:glycosyltransferase involved in cell wall biosynthesis